MSKNIVPQIFSTNRFLAAVKMVNEGVQCSQIFESLALDVNSRINLKGIAVHRVEPDGRLKQQFSFGYPKEIAERYIFIDPRTEDIPGSRAFNTGQILVLDSPVKTLEMFPQSCNWDFIPGTFITIPLKLNGLTCGVMSFTFTAPLHILEEQYSREDILRTLETMAEISQLAYGRGRKAAKGENVDTQEQRRSELPLNERQVRILDLLCKGHTNNEIAACLAFSPATIRLELSKLYSQLGVKNRQEATHVAFKYLQS